LIRSVETARCFLVLIEGGHRVGDENRVNETLFFGEGGLGRRALLGSKATELRLRRIGGDPCLLLFNAALGPLGIGERVRLGGSGLVLVVRHGVSAFSRRGLNEEPEMRPSPRERPCGPDLRSV